MSRRRWRFPVLRIAILGALGLALWWSATRDDISGRATVNDGDTITLNGEKIRIYGIDAPELSQTCRDRNGASYDCGRLAQREMERLAKRPMSCDAVETDRYGRTVAICYADGEDVGGAMVSSGWARAYLSYSLRYAAEETRARAADRGLWAGEFDDPWAFREDNLEDDLIAFAWRWIMERIF
ncbi:MAG: thermonuclease family protein [Pseudomonadota bacterium]